MFGVIRFLLIFAVGKVFAMGLCWMPVALCSSLIFSHVREKDKALLRSIMVGGRWNGFFLGRVRRMPVPCRFCGPLDGSTSC